MSVLFKSITTALICSLYPLISTSSSANYVTSLFFVLFAFKTSNSTFAGFVLIYSSLTSCLSISVCVHSESINTYNYNSFLFYILIFACTFGFLSLLFYWLEIMYWLWTLVIKILCTMPTWNLQNPLNCLFSCHLVLVYCSSSSSILIYNLWQCIPLCCICNTF